MDACFQKWKTVYRNGRVKGGQDLYTVYGRAAVMMCCRRFGAILVQLRYKLEHGWHTRGKRSICIRKRKFRRQHPKPCITYWWVR